MTRELIGCRIYIVFVTYIQACYLLMVPERPGGGGCGSGASQSTLFTWIGVRSTIIDRSSADELATKIIKVGGG